MRAARALGVAVPDVHAGGAGGASSVCPPHDRRADGSRGAATAMARAAGAALNLSSRAPPTLDALARVTVGLVVVSHDAPASLAAALTSWREEGLLSLVDDAVVVLSAPLEEEVAAMRGAGFRVYTPAADEMAALNARHADWLAQWPDRPPFPPVRDYKGRPATYVGPAQAVAFLDMATDLVLFAEKDYVLPRGTDVAAVFAAGGDEALVLLVAQASPPSGEVTVEQQRLAEITGVCVCGRVCVCVGVCVWVCVCV